MVGSFVLEFCSKKLFLCDVKVQYFKFRAKNTLLPEMIHLNTNGAYASKKKGRTYLAIIGKILYGQKQQNLLQPINF